MSIVDELVEGRRKATAELIKLAADVKLMVAREGQLRAAIEAAPPERAAALRAELAQLEIDRAEQEAFVRDQLRARRELDAKLRVLQAREGTVVAELAALEGDSPFAAAGGAWDRMADAERKIEDDEALAELGAGEIDAAEAAQDAVRRVGREQKAEDELAALKKKLRGDG